jgi:succinyl-CoA synthetase beta subunit
MFALKRIVSKRLVSKDVPVRFLNLHEYQSKELMEKFGVQVQRGKVAGTPLEAASVAREILASNPKAELVLKAQIHAGGRGKGTFDSGFKGGVHITKSADSIKDLSSKMFNRKLVTKQTGAEGQLVSKVLVNESINIHRELYFAILMDRAHNGPVVVASTQGGMDIEEVAHKDPSAIITEPVDITVGLTEAQATKLAKRLGFEGHLLTAAVKQFKALYALFIGTDATQVEINPLAVGSVAGVAGSDTVFAVDAKLNFDDNAAFRQQPIYAQRDKAMEDPRDVAAEEAGLNYIGLDGKIGCMVNGAGLAMATMDIIKLHGGAPANFLDVGGGATAEQVTTAFKILTADPQVKAILVNIFGGIMKCDTIANGIIKAAKEVGLQVPLVVRLEGTNVELGKKLIRESGLNIVAASDLDDAAIKAVATVA